MKKFLLIFGVFLFLIFIGAYFFLKTNLTSVSNDAKNRIFVIESGQGLKEISQELEEKELIKNKFAFISYNLLKNQYKNIQSGTYRLSPNLSTPEIAQKLTTGGISDYWLKVIEGYRLEEVSLLFPEGLAFNDKDFLKDTKGKEGYFFPDSYLIPEYFSLDQTLNFVYNNFDQQFNKAKEGTITNLSDKKALILASLIEREGKSLKSKQMIAGVLLNRLNIGMALQVDASVQYARDNQENISKYWQPVSRADLSIDSPFNTYKNPSLPPSPICNPGYNSLYSVFNPIDSDYFYYITGNNGNMYYAKTLEEHNQNIQKYL